MNLFMCDLFYSKFGLPTILLCFSADATLLFMISMSVLQPAGECEKPLKQDNHTKFNPGHDKSAVHQPGNWWRDLSGKQVSITSSGADVV